MKQNGLEIDPHTYGQLIFEKDAEIIQWIRIVFSTMMLE